MRKILSMVAATAATMMLATPAMAQPASSAGMGQTTLNICTGGKDGVYFFAGTQIAEALAGSKYKINIYTTRGSDENLDRLMAGQCDAAIAQNDAIRVKREKNASLTSQIRRVRELYQEYVHFACNRASGITRITQLTKDHIVAIGPLGTGIQITWESFTLADPKRYGVVQTSTLRGREALDAVAEGLDAHCMLFTSGLNPPLMVQDAQQLGDKLWLVAADDKDFDNALDERKQPIYTRTEIPGGTYRKIQDSGFSCAGSCATKTVSVGAIFVMRRAWSEQNGSDAYADISRSLDRALSAIRKKANNEK